MAFSTVGISFFFLSILLCFVLYLLSGKIGYDMIYARMAGFLLDLEWVAAGLDLMTDPREEAENII
jgi:hypothetical protein